MKVSGKLAISEIIISDHAAQRWSQRINPGEELTPEGIAFLLRIYLNTEQIEWLYPYSLGALMNSPCKTPKPLLPG